MRLGEMKRILATAVVAAAIVGLAGTAAIAEDQVPGTWLAAASDMEEAKTAPPAEPAEQEWTKPIPLSFGIDYTLVSDYVWRGVNLSEYRGEGRERPNHQMNLAASYDTGDFGSLNAGIWFEWYGGQKQLTPGCESDLQEVDYTLSWSYEIAPVGTTVEVGWIAYQFPQASGDAQNTYEWFIGLSFDDSKWFGTENPVLNPHVKYYYDMDLVEGGQFIELGISHDFLLADCGCQTPIVKDITLTPSATLGVDHRYFTNSTKLANILFGLAASYDLGKACGLSEKCGSVTLTGFLNYSQALGIEDDVPGYNDEFFGGVNIGYSW